MCSCIGGFGSGLLLDLRKIRPLRPPRNPPFSNFYIGRAAQLQPNVIRRLWAWATSSHIDHHIGPLRPPRNPPFPCFTKSQPWELGFASFPPPDNIAVARIRRLGTWPRGVTVSTLDSESSDRGSNLREAFRQCAQFLAVAIAAFGVESGPKNILVKLVFAIASSKASLRKGQ